MSLAAGFARYSGDVWRRRHFWLSLARLDLEMRYRDSILGIAWSLLNPLGMTAVLCFAFGAIFNQPFHSYLPFMLCGIASWNFLSGACLEGCHSIRGGEKFMRVYPVPIAVYALRTLCSQLFHFSILLGVSVGLSWILLGFHNLAVLPVLLPVMLILALFGLSLILLFGIFDIHFPDNKHMLQVGLQMLLYLLPIMYPPSGIQNRLFRAVLEYNPLASFIVLVRSPIVDGRVPGAGVWLTASATTLLTFALACWMVRRFERTIIFQL